LRSSYVSPRKKNSNYLTTSKLSLITHIEGTKRIDFEFFVLNRTSPFRHSRWIKLGLMSLIGVVAALNMAFTTYLSMYNYPGGAAMVALHSLEDLRPIQGMYNPLRFRLVMFTNGVIMWIYQNSTSIWTI
jgi:hypothetical protein